MSADKLIELIRNNPYYRFLGIQVRRYGRGEAKLRMESKGIINPDGVFDEGRLITLGSVASQLAAVTLVGPGRTIIPLEPRISMLVPSNSTRVTARAKIDHLRARLVQARFHIYDSARERIATGGLLAYILPPEQLQYWKTQPISDGGESDFDAITIVDSAPPVTIQMSGNKDEIE